ncbi:MAG: carboxypeptidase regulatory-like domain-containing protein [Terracidiphilus sp.]|nr:carboxypeptidase regulatory-like domain-containing protein [Terracidiphilus sp.]
MNRLRKLCTLRSLAVLALAGIFAIFASSNVAAQSAGVGTITGTVEDAAQAVIPGAAVTVTNVDTNVVHSYTTNAAGLYSAPFLQPGHYKVSAKAASFGTTEATGLTLQVGQTLTLNLTMSVKTETTTIEVEGSGAILDTEKTEVSQVVDQQMVQNLPVNARNWSSFVLLTPAVTQDGTSGMISFHGISGLYNQNYVDGANNNQMLFAEARGRASGAPYVYSVDSIKEFQAETSNYSVEFGQAAGGQVNAITKSGANALHGDLFYYLRYPDLNALDPMSKFNALYGSAASYASAKAALLTQPVHQQNQFGGSVGGPLIKDKLFYFLTYDGFRKVGRALYYNTYTITQTATASNSAGNIISPYQCPTASNPYYTGTYRVTDAMCTAGIDFLLKMGNAAPSRYAKQNLFFPRLDWHINSKNDAFIDFNAANFDSSYGYNASPTISNSSWTTNGPTSYHERFLVGGLTTTINDRMVNQVHGQWGRDLETAGVYDAAPSVGVGVLTYGMPNALPRIAEPDEKRIQGSDVFSWVRGRHTLKFGGDVNIIHEVMINLYQGGGLYGYSDTTYEAQFRDWLFDAFQGVNGNTDPYAGYHYNSFVQTVDQLNTKANTQGTDDFWMKMYDVFAQDTWSVNRKLTINAGLRYDLQMTPPPTLPNSNYAPLSNQYTQSINNVATRVTPRIGFSYQLYPGTVVRGGYGIYTALNQGSTYYAMRVENGVVQVNYNYSGCKSSCTSAFNTAAVVQYPNVPFLPPGPSVTTALVPTGAATSQVKGPSVMGVQSFHGLDPNFVPPFAHEMSMSVEQLLPGKTSLALGYVGTRGMRLPVFVDAQLIGQKPSGHKTYNVLDASGTLVKQMTVPVYLPTDRRYQNGATQNASTQLATFNAGFSVANTWYNALTASLRKPFSKGLEFVANYTWAHASDTGQVGGANGTFYGGDVPLDPNNIKGENGQSDTDIRNRITFSFVYQPKFNFANLLTRSIVNGWSFSGSEIYSTGQPVYLGLAGSTIFSGSTSASSYADDGGIYGGAISSGSGSPTNGRPPYIGRNSIPMPSWNNADLRLARKFAIRESMSLDLNLDAFNFVNQTIVQGVNSSYGNYSASGASITLPSGSKVTCSAASGVTDLQGCFSPYTGTGASAFNTKTTTTSNLYGPRQLQVSAKFTF